MSGPTVLLLNSAEETPADVAARLDRDPPPLAEAILTAADLLLTATRLTPIPYGTLGDLEYARAALLASARKAGVIP